MIANMNAIVASHKMSPASVPSLAENVESTLVDMLGLCPVVTLQQTLPRPLGCVWEAKR
jgi:hypothetical protein